MQTILELIAPLMLASLWAWTINALNRQKQEMGALKCGVRTTLRSRLVDLHAKYVVTGAGCPQWVKDEAEDVYLSYHTLGGNGVGTQLYTEILQAHTKGRTA